MRVIAGKYKRTPLKTLEGEEITRPTRDMVKEALFSSIAIYSDTVFLDLFAGSGAIGIEALSRGAEDVVFNDANKAAASVVRENLKKVKEVRKVLQMDYQDCLACLDSCRFDYIYCDPPYLFRDFGRIFELVEEHGLLNRGGIIIAEVHRDTDLKKNYGNLLLFKERRYGINKLLYFRKEDET